MGVETLMVEFLLLCRECAASRITTRTAVVCVKGCGRAMNASPSARIR